MDTGDMSTFLGRLFKKNRRRVYVIFDAGAYSVRSVLFAADERGVFALKKRVHILQKKKLSGRAAETTAAIRDVLLGTIKEIERIPTKIYLGLASGMAFNRVATFTIERKNPAAGLRNPELDEAIAAISNAGGTRISADAYEYARVHTELIRLTIDGYDRDPRRAEGLTGKTMNLSLAFTYVRADFADETQNLRRIFGGLPIIILPTQMEVISAAIRTVPARNFMLLKMGGTITEVAAVKEKTLDWAESLPVGGDDITREIAGALHLSFARAEDLKRQYRTLSPPPQTVETVTAIVNASIARILQSIAGLLREKQSLLPPFIYLYGGGAEMPAVAEALRDAGWARDFLYTDAITTHTLVAEEIIHHALVHIGSLKGPEDVGLAALGLKVIEHRYERLS